MSAAAPTQQQAATAREKLIVALDFATIQEAEALVTTLGDSDEITQTMKAHVRLGDALGLAATPSFIIANVAVLGYPGRYRLQAILDAASACGKVQC